MHEFVQNYYHSFSCWSHCTSQHHIIYEIVFVCPALTHVIFHNKHYFLQVYFHTFEVTPYSDNVRLLHYKLTVVKIFHFKLSLLRLHLPKNSFFLNGKKFWLVRISLFLYSSYPTFCIAVSVNLLSSKSFVHILYFSKCYGNRIICGVIKAAYLYSKHQPPVSYFLNNWRGLFYHSLKGHMWLKGYILFYSRAPNVGSLSVNITTSVNWKCLYYLSL